MRRDKYFGVEALSHIVRARTIKIASAAWRGRIIAVICRNLNIALFISVNGNRRDVAIRLLMIRVS